MKKIFTLTMVFMMILVSFPMVFATEGPENIVENSSKKDREIAEYIDKYNNEAYGKTAYYIGQVQKYSIPVCFIGLVIGALNFFIIGNKKLDKKESGFNTIVIFLLGFAFFQILPLAFALLVAGR